MGAISLQIFLFGGSSQELSHERSFILQIMLKIGRLDVLTFFIKILEFLNESLEPII